MNQPVNTNPIKRTRKINPQDTRTVIDWPACTPDELYLLQYYGKTPAIRNRAKRELLKR